MRLVPVPDGVMVYLTDATEKRLRDTERKAAERSADGSRGGREGMAGKVGHFFSSVNKRIAIFWIAYRRRPTPWIP
jgi:hypothetical protein